MVLVPWVLGETDVLCVDTGVKIHSWLNRWQFRQRPSSAFSKPEHRIWECKLSESGIRAVVTFRLLQYRQAIAVRCLGVHCCKEADNDGLFTRNPIFGLSAVCISSSLENGLFMGSTEAIVKIS
jgi:hypothetical protein